MSNDVYRCTYCGALADSVDHVVPRHILKRAGELELNLSNVFRMRSWQVPACCECNSMIGGRLFATLAERRACAHAGIRRKYRQYLAIPNWDEEELAEMGPLMRREIARSIRVREGIRDRLRWTGGNGEVVDLTAILELAKSIARDNDRRSVA
jgi:hypothetical protein